MKIKILKYLRQGNYSFEFLIFFRKYLLNNRNRTEASLTLKLIKMKIIYKLSFRISQGGKKFFLNQKISHPKKGSPIWIPLEEMADLYHCKMNIKN